MFRTPITSKPLALFAAIALQSASPTFAQDQVACTILGCEKVNIEVSPFASTSDFTVRQVWDVVNEILSVSGLAPNFQVVETEEVGNAAAVIIEKERFLAFNPVWMARYKDDPNAKWQLYAVMAHEVGHHLQGHTLTGLGSRPPTELEADEYAGFTLAALGASLDEALSLWQTLDDEGSATHPPRHQRLDAVTRGWSRGSGRAAPAPASADQTASAPPPIIHRMRAARDDESCYENAGTGLLTFICTSSNLAEQSGNTYTALNLLDGDPATAWVEGIDGDGIGEYIALQFSEPTELYSIDFLNGYTKSDSIYAANGRVREMLLTFSTGDQMIVEFEDTTNSQTLDLIGTPPTLWLTMEIQSVFEGTRWSDTALSEIKLH